MRKFLSAFVVFWLIWSVLSGFQMQDVLIGGIVSLVLSVVVSRYLSFSFDFRIIYKVFLFIVVYIPVFLYRMVLANLDMARRVLSPSIPLNPGFVKVKTKIKSKTGQLTLANSITLTPGTMSVEVDEETIYVHWVDVQGEGKEDYSKEISGSFEDILGGIFR